MSTATPDPCLLECGGFLRSLPGEEEPARDEKSVLDPFRRGFLGDLLGSRLLSMAFNFSCRVELSKLVFRRSDALAGESA